MAWISRTFISTSVKSPNSFASASAASTAFWAACSKRTKNSLFLGRSDRRTVVLLWRLILRHRDRGREIPPGGPRLQVAVAGFGADASVSEGQKSVTG